MESNIKSKLYSKAKTNKDLEKPKIENKIIKKNRMIVNETNKNEDLVLPLIKNRIEVSTPNQIIEIKEKISKNIIEKKLPQYIHNRMNKKFLKPSIKTNLKEYLKENILKFIQFYLDPLSLKNFMLSCKKFNKSAIENDQLWYLYYSKKFNTKKIKYDEKRGKWKSFFLNAIMTIFQNNYNSLKTKYLQKFTKNSYNSKKDPYFISNHLYSYLKPIFLLELDDKQYKLKYIFSDKILSHINFFANFDMDYIDLNKIKTLKLKVSEKNIGLVDIKLLNYEIKKKKFEEFKTDSKICKIFYDNDLIISTFDRNLIFFLNISIPICKICEILFDFMKGIHKDNLNYFDDVDSNFGLYDYSLLINIKSWNNIFYSININTLDFKDLLDSGEDRFLYYEYTGKSIKLVKFNFNSCI